MSFEFLPARRENVPLLIGLAGGTGSGKTLSALKIAQGLAGDRGFAVIDTENGRALEYADSFAFDHRPLHAPFRPERYAEAVAKAAADGAPVIVIDSGSHAYAGEGGLLDWHEEELTRMAGDDYKKREAMTFAAWVKPKQAQKRFVSQLLQVPAHVIVCLRAEEKIEIVKKDGKTIVQPKRSLVGAAGWVPVCEKNFAYEMTLSLLFTADARGIPKPIKLNEAHAPFVPLDRPIGVETGVQLAAWASGGAAPTQRLQADIQPSAPAPAEDSDWPTGEEPNAGLTGSQLVALCREGDVTPAQVNAKMQQLFPGRARLTNAERGQLWEALRGEPTQFRIPEGAA